MEVYVGRVWCCKAELYSTIPPIESDRYQLISQLFDGDNQLILAVREEISIVASDLQFNQLTEAVTEEISIIASDLQAA